MSSHSAEAGSSWTRHVLKKDRPNRHTHLPVENSVPTGNSNTPETTAQDADSSTSEKPAPENHFYQQRIEELDARIEGIKAEIHVHQQQSAEAWTIERLQFQLAELERTKRELSRRDGIRIAKQLAQTESRNARTEGTAKKLVFRNWIRIGDSFGLDFSACRIAAHIGDYKDGILSDRLVKFLHVGEESQAWKIYKTTPAQAESLRIGIRRTLIERYIPDTNNVTHGHYVRNIPENARIDESDIQQIGYLGMITAFDKYDPSFGTTFMEFANANRRSYIVGAIVDKIRKGHSRKMLQHRKDVKPKMDFLEQRLGRLPTIEEFCNHFGDAYREILEDPMFYSGVFNQQEAGSEDGSIDKVDMMSVIQSRELRRDWSTEDRVWFQNLILSSVTDERQRFAIYAYYWAGMNNERIAASPKMNCSTSTALSIRLAGERKIRAAFTRQQIIEMLELHRRQSE